MDIANPLYGIRKRRRMRRMIGGGALAVTALAVLVCGPVLILLFFDRSRR